MKSIDKMNEKELRGRIHTLEHTLEMKEVNMKSLELFIDQLINLFKILKQNHPDLPEVKAINHLLEEGDD